VRGRGDRELGRGEQKGRERENRKGEREEKGEEKGRERLVPRVRAESPVVPGEAGPAEPIPEYHQYWHCIGIKDSFSLNIGTGIRNSSGIE
jgi:hypothetical protein